MCCVLARLRNILGAYCKAPAYGLVDLSYGGRFWRHSIMPLHHIPACVPGTIPMPPFASKTRDEIHRPLQVLPSTTQQKMHMMLIVAANSLAACAR